MLQKSRNKQHKQVKDEATKSNLRSKYSYWNLCQAIRYHCSCLIRGPAERQGDEKLVYRLIQMFSTEIFSKRRKNYTSCRKTRVFCVLRRMVGPPVGVEYNARQTNTNYPKPGGGSAMPKYWVCHKRRGTGRQGILALIVCMRDSIKAICKAWNGHLS